MVEMLPFVRLRRLSLISFSVFGALIVILCFVSTEIHFAKNKWVLGAYRRDNEDPRKRKVHGGGFRNPLDVDSDADLEQSNPHHSTSLTSTTRSLEAVIGQREGFRTQPSHYANGLMGIRVVEPIAISARTIERKSVLNVSKNVSNDVSPDNMSTNTVSYKRKPSGNVPNSSHKHAVFSIILNNEIDKNNDKSLRAKPNKTNYHMNNCTEKGCAVSDVINDKPVQNSTSERVNISLAGIKKRNDFAKGYFFGKLRPQRIHGKTLAQRYAPIIRPGSQSVLRHVHWQPFLDNHTYPYLITPDKNCMGPTRQYRSMTVIVMVLTSPTHFSRRRIIRRTWVAWAMQKRLDMKTIFLLGKTYNKTYEHYIKNEARIYRDILQEDFDDTYVNLTLKTIMGLKWTTTFCPNAKFVMKVDDDVAVNVEGLIDMVNRRNTTGFIGGIVTSGSTPYRDPNSKWYVPYSIYPHSTYPTYLQGKSYIMSMDVAANLFQVSKHIEIFPWEDVFIGICLREMGLAPQEIWGFRGSETLVTSSRIVRKSWTSLNLVQKLIIVYDLPEDQMEAVWHAWHYGSWPDGKAKSGLFSRFKKLTLH